MKLPDIGIKKVNFNIGFEIAENKNMQHSNCMLLKNYMLLNYTLQCIKIPF